MFSFGTSVFLYVSVIFFCIFSLILDFQVFFTDGLMFFKRVLCWSWNFNAFSVSPKWIFYLLFSGLT